MNVVTPKTLFSIVTIVYNGEGFIEETIKSTINQTYKNIEYIIVDGASKDGTLKIIDKYGSSVTKVISEPDLGLYDAMNKGIDQCTGEYIIFMNGGDRFANNDVLKSIDNELMKSDVRPDFIYGDSYIDTGLSTVLKYKKARDAKYFWYGMFTNHQAMIYRRSLLKENDLRYDLKYKISADYKLTLQALTYSKTNLYINIPFCVFVLGGVSVQLRESGLDEAEKARKEVLNYTSLQLLGIRYLIYGARFVEDHLGWLHTLLRFSRK